MSLLLPKEWNTYYNSIRDRCQNLVDLGIWSGIDINQLNAWKQNFKTEEERYFSACILDSLIYRSNQQTFSLIHQLLYKNLNNLFRLNKLAEFQSFPYNMQSKTDDPLVRFVPVVTHEEPVTKSSFEILRFFKRHFNINERWMIYPLDIQRCIKDEGVKAIIFIDDFLGTGTQFDETCIYAQIDNIIKNEFVVYAPLVAHELGINSLSKMYGNLKVTYAEKLTINSNSFFNNYFKGSEAEAKKFYIELMNDRGIKYDTVTPYGYGNMELTFSFEHAAPDNSLQILHNSSDDWVPLFNH